MKGNILVFCRDEACFNKLMELLRSRNLQTTRVEDEADLLLALLENQYGVVIYDLENSNLDCVKMVKIIRRVRPKIPLLAISNDHSRELGGRILQEGVAYYAVKPIDMSIVSEAIVAAMN